MGQETHHLSPHGPCQALSGAASEDEPVEDWRGLGPQVKDALRQLRLLGEGIESEPESLLFGPRRARGEQP